MILPLLLAAMQAPAPVPIPRIEAAVRIDGLLDEPVWQEAARLTDFHQYEPVDARPAAERTEVRVWYSPDAIHFGIIAYDSRPAEVRATRADRDAIDDDDHIIIYLDTFLDRRRAYFFAVNPYGVQQDGVRTEGAQTPGRMFGGDTDINPDFLWESQGRLTEDGWMVEVRIPFKTLRYAGGAEQEWGLQVTRRVQRTGYLDTWTDVRRASASFLGQSGSITGLRDLERGVVVEAQPFLTATAEGARAPTGYERTDPEADAGVNARLGFTNLTLDATVNPDFSQVEADAGQVTVNERFALFYPEKRPFFLEGIELFGTPNQLVYTRRIANPIGGAKLTGKIGSLGIAHITAVDETLGGDDVLFNITRLRRDIGAGSVLGATFTDRSTLSGGPWNRVAAADARIVFGSIYYAEAQFGGSWTDAGSGSRFGELWKAVVDRTGHYWGFHYEANGFNEDFDAGAGFVPRTGIISANAFNRFRWYGPPGAAVETITLFVGPNRLWRYDDFPGDALEGEESATVMTQLRGGWSINVRGARAFFELDSLDYAQYESGGAVYMPLDEVSGPQFSMDVSTPSYRAFDASVGARHGRVPIFDEGSRGNQTSLVAAVSLRPTSQIRIALSNTWARIARERDGEEFARTILPRVQAEVQPSRALFFRVITEYRAERRAALEDARTGAPLVVNGAPSEPVRTGDLRVDLLASYEPAPGTVVFLGYGSSHAARQNDRLSAVRRTADGLFLKLAYQFRW